MISKKSQKSKNCLKWFGNGPFWLKLGGNGAESNHDHFFKWSNTLFPSYLTQKCNLGLIYGPKWVPKRVGGLADGLLIIGSDEMPHLGGNLTCCKTLSAAALIATPAEETERYLNSM